MELVGDNTNKGGKRKKEPQSLPIAGARVPWLFPAFVGVVTNKPRC